MTPDLSIDELRPFADELADAYDTGVAVEPPTERRPELTIDDAYAIQRLQVERWVAGGDPIVGYKIGLTSVAMQRQLGVSEPDYGCITSRMVALPGAPLPGDRLLQPRIEPELAFVLGRDLAAPATLADAVRAVEYVLPALEVVDSRIRDWRIKLVDTIADNASCGAVILGGQPRRLDAIDLALTGCNLTVNGSVAATGASGAVLGNPLHALVWLAQALGRYGVTLEAGSIVLSGACTAAVPVSGGDVVTAELGPLGSVTTVFASDLGESA